MASDSPTSSSSAPSALNTSGTSNTQHPQSTQNTQYDKIGKKYEGGFVMAAVEPEAPSVIKALGDVRGKRCLGTFSIFFGFF